MDAPTAHHTLTEALEAIRANSENPRAAIADFEAKAERLQAEANALRQIANGMRGLLGEPPAEVSSAGAQASGPPVDRTRPEGMEAIRRIMKDGGVWTSRQLLDEMKKRGWESKGSPNPIRPTEAAINRLWKVKREIERVGRGEYRYIGTGAQTQTSPPPPEFALLTAGTEP